MKLLMYNFSLRLATMFTMYNYIKLLTILLHIIFKGLTIVLLSCCELVINCMFFSALVTYI